MRARKVAGIALGVVASLFAIALILVLVVSNSDPGRMFVRKQLLSFLQEKAHGIVRIGRIEGNLLTGATIHDLSITDSAGVPFLAAEEIRARYRLGDFLGKKLWFRDVVLVRPLLMFDKPPDGEWNTKRIFPGDQSDTLPDDPNAPGGWGDWLALFDARVIDGKVVGDTPLANVPLALGEHEVVFRHPQLGERRQTAMVQAGVQTRVSASFNP